MKHIRAKTASDVQRLRSDLSIKLLRNKDLYLVGVQQPGVVTVIECIPKTLNDRYVELTVPGVTRMTVPWEEVMSIEPMAVPDEDEITDRPHPFSASDLPFAS